MLRSHHGSTSARHSHQLRDKLAMLSYCDYRDRSCAARHGLIPLIQCTHQVKHAVWPRKTEQQLQAKVPFENLDGGTHLSSAPASCLETSSCAATAACMRAGAPISRINEAVTPSTESRRPQSPLSPTPLSRAARRAKGSSSCRTFSAAGPSCKVQA
jgi:hypothetical protein